MDARKGKLFFVLFLTFVRFPLVLLFFAGAVVYSVYGDMRGDIRLFIASFSVLVISAITDIFDGYLARRWNVATGLGAQFDPLMDKFFYLSTWPLLVFIATRNHHIPHAIILLIFTVVFLARDQWVTFLRSVGSIHKVSGAANWSGKLRTIINFPVICGIYFFEESPSQISFLNEWVVYFFEAVAFVVNIISVIVYTRFYWPYLYQSASLETEKNSTEDIDD